MKKRLISFLLSTVLIGSSLILSSVTAFAKTEAKVIDINSGAERSAEFVSVNEEINTASGSRRLIMTGLKDSNKDLTVKAIEDNYDENNQNPIKLVDNAFCDADKWDIFDYDDMNNADSNQCWASAASNMLWISGWASKVNSPITGEPFKSEDEIFALFNSKFSNNGSEAPEAITWFFTGEYYSPTYSKNASLIFTDDPSDGVMKQFYCPLVQENYIVPSNPDVLSNLERLDKSADSAAVIHVGVSKIDDGKVLNSSEHALTAVGVITDPTAEKAEDKYKAVLIINSDDDAEPSEEAAKLDTPTDEQKLADKEKRPNSYNLYPLKYKKDSNGTAYWEVVGFDDSGEYEWYLHRLDVFPIYSEDVIDSCSETEGTKSITDNVDLVLETVFTTSKTTTIDRLFQSEKTVKKNTFAADEAINLSYFISNRSSVIFDEEYFKGRSVRVDWEVVNKATDKVVLQGSDYAELPIWSLREINCVTPLNSKNGKHIDLDAGEYTVTVKMNSDKAIPEAYFLNNDSESFDFTVTSAKLNKTSLSLKAGEETTLKVANGTVKAWKSSDSNVVKVTGGKLVALKKGTATVTATLTTGETLTCKVTVKTSPKLSKSSVSVKKGKTVSVKISGKVNSVNNVYTNTKYAKILSKKTATSLKVKGLKKGSTTLKIKVNGVILKLRVNVK